MKQYGKKLLALVMALVLCIGLAAPAFAAEDTEGDLFAGDWVETIAHRATMNISLNEDGSYTVCVNWPDSAFQTYSWNLTGTFDESENAIVYRLGKKVLHTFAEDGTDTESEPQIGLAGRITLKNGQLFWLEADESEPTTFERLEYEPLTEPEDNPFADVAENDYFYDAVQWARVNGITTGTSDTAFSPDGDCTRAQVVTFLWRMAGSPEQDAAELKFTDVELGSWYEQAVIWAVKEGITTGTSETAFSPKGKATRGQVLTLLYRMMGEPEVVAANPYQDVAEDDWFCSAVLWAYEKNLIDGNNTPSEDHFAPKEICRRADIVSFLYGANKAAEAEPVYAHQFIGQWHDLTSGRASLTIVPQREDGYGEYVVTLHWGSSAWESRQWEFYAVFEEETGTIFYANGETADVTYAEDGTVEKRDVIYDDNTGHFFFKNGALCWNDNREDRSGEMLFERIFTEAPDEEIFTAYFKEIGSYLAGTSGASLREAAVVRNVLAFADQYNIWSAYIPDLRDAMLNAWEALTEEERNAFDANFMSVVELADKAFSDYESVKGLFDDAGVTDMASFVTDPVVQLSWDALKSNTFTMGNSEG